MSSISGIYSVASYGLNSAANQLASSARKIADFGTSSESSDDLTGAVMNLMMDKATYQANAQVLKAAHLMLGTVMDVLDTPLRS